MTAGARPGDLLDLLVIGGLTIDRFPGDELAPGGSVLHATRAASHAGLRAAVLTSAGREPTARSGIDELQRLTAALEVQPAGETIAFRHRETDAGRRLWLERPGGTIDLPDDAIDRLGIHAILFAPVASEIGAPLLRRASELWSPGTWTQGAILQGWLRRALPGSEVAPIAPGTLSDELVAALASLHVLIASREDLLAADARPVQQLGMLRTRIGDGPILIVTDGPEGLWIDDGSTPRHLPAPWRVEGVPMVGAGDALAALFVAGLARRSYAPSADDLDALATEAMRGVAEMLEARRRR